MHDIIFTFSDRKKTSEEKCFTLSWQKYNSSGLSFCLKIKNTISNLFRISALPVEIRKHKTGIY
jgi:hypothetical protein